MIDNRNLYKKKFTINFYDKTGEKFICSFNNVKEILKFQNKQITRKNIQVLNVEIYRSQKRKDNMCYFLGFPAQLYLCNMLEDIEYN